MPEAGRTVDEGDGEDVAETCWTREVETVDSDLGPDKDDAEDACSTDWAGVDGVSGKTVDCRKEVTKLGHADKVHGSTEQHPLKLLEAHSYQVVPAPQDCCRRACEMPMIRIRDALWNIETAAVWE